MEETLQVSIESPQSGWMSLRLRAGGRQFVAVMSHAPYDSLRDLIRALTALLKGRTPEVVRWNAEPEEFDFELGARGRTAELRVTRFRDHRRAAGTRQLVFSCRLPPLGLCLPFLEELRGLRGRGDEDVFEKNWRREFPEAELREYARALREYAREIKEDR